MLADDKTEVEEERAMIDVVVEAPVARITLNRPQALNALTAAMLDDLASAIEECGADPSVSVVVLRGAGRAFSAGVDLKALDGRSLDGGAVGDVLDIPARRAQQAITEAACIVIAAVHGYCFTGALELALACDLFIVTEDAVLADTHAKFGLRPSWGMSQRLPRAAGPAKARLLCYTSRQFSGAEAASWGIASEAVPTDDFDDALQRLVEEITATSPQSLTAHKRLHAAAAQLGLQDGLRFEAAARFDIADTDERIASFR
jgi:enoyl-CoA hydratase/carnithine racemase